MYKIIFSIFIIIASTTIALNIGIIFFDNLKIEPLLVEIHKAKFKTKFNSEEKFLSAISSSHDTMKEHIKSIPMIVGSDTTDYKLLLDYYCNDILPDQITYNIFRPFKSFSLFTNRLLYVIAVAKMTGLNKFYLYGCSTNQVYVYFETSNFKLLDHYSPSIHTAYNMTDKESTP